MEFEPALRYLQGETAPVARKVHVRCDVPRGAREAAPQPVETGLESAELQTPEGLSATSGELRAVPRAVISAAGILQGARGGVDIPEADRAKARRHLARYYRSMDRTPPWEDGGRSTSG